MKRVFILLLAVCAFSLSARSSSDFKDWINSLAADSSGHLYAGSNANGIFVSADAGASWQPTKLWSGVTSITVTKNGTVLAFANGYGLKRYLFLLTQGGTELDSVALTFIPSSIVAAPDGRLYATTAGEGVYTSSDDGAHWSSVAWPFWPGAILPALTLLDNDIMLIGTKQGAFYSLDKGEHWSRGEAHSRDSVTLTKILPSADGRMYAAGFEGLQGHVNEIFLSPDTGKNWTPISRLKFTIDAMAIDPAGRVLVGTSNGVYHISPEGDTLHLGLAGVAVNGLGVQSVFAPQKDTLFAGAYGGVYRTVNGGADWELLHNGLVSDMMTGDYTVPFSFGGNIIHGVVDNQNNIIVATDTAGMFRSVDWGRTWIPIGIRLQGLRSIVVDPTGALYAAAYEGVYVSTDHGITWTTTDYPVNEFKRPISLAVVTRYEPLDGTDSTHMVPHPIIYAGADFGVYRFDPTGSRQWVGTGKIYSSISSLTVSDSDLFAMNCYGYAYIAQSGGTGWTLMAKTNVFIRPMVSDASGRLFAGSPHGVFRSLDKGATWETKRFGITDTAIISIEVDNKGTVFAGSFNAGDIYRSTDHGENWTKIATTGGRVHCLLLSRDGENLYAGTGERLFRTNTTAVTLDQSRNGTVPEGFSLLQNYPNPFNPSTTIRFGLPSPCHVSLTIFDALGRKVTTLIAQELSAGYYSVPFEAPQLASGIYLCRISALPHNGAASMPFVQTRKLLLLR